MVKQKRKEVGKAVIIIIADDPFYPTITLEPAEPVLIIECVINNMIAKAKKAINPKAQENVDENECQHSNLRSMVFKTDRIVCGLE